MSALNLNADDAEILKTALLKAVRDNKAVPSKRNEYGQKYIIDFEMNHSGKTARIRSAWIIRNDENFPRLVTCYVM
jgi:hypothetical protein